MQDQPSYLQHLAKESTFARVLVPKCSEMMGQVNFSSKTDVEALQLSILSRLTGGYSESNLCDVLAYFDLHTMYNFHCLDSEIQMKMLQLLLRYFK